METMATCANECGILTIDTYLQGKIRNIEIPENTILSICADVGIDPEAPVSELTLMQKELALAWLYVWVAGSPTQWSGARDKHPNWEHEDGAERMSANVLNNYLKMANAIFEKYDLAPVGESEYGFVGRGICNPRIY